MGDVAIGIGPTAPESTMSLSRRPLLRPARAALRRVAPLLVVPLLVASGASHLLARSARADEPVAAAAPAVAPRQAALDVVIRRLERHLTALRKARAELESGRAEPAPEGDVARRRADVDLRAVREVVRYEAARVKAAAALAEAVASKDAGRIGDAQATLDTLDTRLVEAVDKLEKSLEAPPGKAPPAKNQAGEGATTSPSSPTAGDRRAPKKPANPTTAPKDSSAMSKGEAADADDDADEGLDDDADADADESDGAP